MQYDIFLSYAREDEGRARELAGALEQEGYSVFWDRQTPVGQNWHSSIDQALQRVKCVVVAWSSGSIKSDWVIEEANFAKNRGMLVPVLFDGTEPPIGFGSIQAADLTEWRAGDQSEPFQHLLNAVREKGSVAKRETRQEPTLLRGEDWCVVFDDRFSQAFPGVRGVEWLSESSTIADRLGILLQRPLQVFAWLRGPDNMHIERFEHIEGSCFLMNIDELNIRRVAAVNQGSYYRKFVYVETGADEPTGAYPSGADAVARQVREFGYAWEEYGLVDDKFPVTREEYDDGAAIVDGKPVDIRGRSTLRVRHISSYNFLIATYLSPINNKAFDYALESYLNRQLQGEEVFDQMCTEIRRLPRRD